MKPTGVVFDKTWRDACSVIRTSRSEVNVFIKLHYLGKWPGVCVLILKLEHALFGCIGVIVFALPPRETDIRYNCKTWELARLWLLDAVPKNAETYFIGQAVKYIRANHQEVGMLVSYADPSVGHQGTIYKAANWKADGRTDEGRKTPRFDYADAKTGKRYSRKGHVPTGTEIVRVPRVSKWRFTYDMR